MDSGDQVPIVDGPDTLLKGYPWMFFVRDKEGVVLQVQAEMWPTMRRGFQLFGGRVAVASLRPELMIWIDDVLCTYNCSSGRGMLEAVGLYDKIFQPAQRRRILQKLKGRR